MTVRRPAVLLAAAVLAAGGLIGCSDDGGQSKPTPAAAPVLDAGLLRATLTRYDVALKDKDPKTVAAAGQAIGGVLQAADVAVFSYDGSTQGRLLVEVADRLDARAADALKAELEKVPGVTGASSTTVQGWAFQLAGPLPRPAVKGVLDPTTAVAVADALNPLLPSGFRTFTPDASSLSVTFAGELKDGPGTIAKARAALAKALGTDLGNIAVEPIPE